jgi:hypothetical protein
MSMIALILSVMFFALVWHDEPAKPAVIKRHSNKNQKPTDL